MALSRTSQIDTVTFNKQSHILKHVNKHGHAMRNLESKWVRIGLSGTTIDGRVIEPQWLTEAAEQYDTNDKYTALIYDTHDRDYDYNFTSFGKVTALEARKENGGKTGLYAKLSPNQNLLYANRNNQLLFTSIEIVEKLPDTGKAYLTALVVTNKPASMGTTELHFSKRDKSDCQMISEPINFSWDDDTKPEINDLSPGIVQQIAQLFSLHSNNRQHVTQEQSGENESMNTEQFNTLSSTLEKQNTALETLGNALQAFTANTQTDNTPADKDNNESSDTDKNNTTDDANVVSVEKFNALSAKLDDVTQRFEAAMNEEKPGTVISPATGDADFDEVY